MSACPVHKGVPLVWCGSCIDVERAWWAKRVLCNCRNCQAQLTVRAAEVLTAQLEAAKA